jgi:hypothetical protein
MKLQASKSQPNIEASLPDNPYHWKNTRHTQHSTPPYGVIHPLP